MEDKYIDRISGRKEEQNAAEEKAETAIAELRNKYAEKVREQYESEAKKLRKERDEALRENWILQQQAEAALPEKLAAAGINGGEAETNIADIRAQYQGDRNEIHEEYSENLSELGAENRKELFENEKDFN